MSRFIGDNALLRILYRYHCSGQGFAVLKYRYSDLFLGGCRSLVRRACGLVFSSEQHDDGGLLLAMLLRIDRRRFVAGIAYHEFAAARDGDLGMPVRIGHGALRRAYDLYDGPGEHSFVLAPNLYRHAACLVFFFISGILCFLPGSGFDTGAGCRGDDHCGARSERECAQEPDQGWQCTCQPEQAVPAFCLRSHHFKAFFSK